MVVMDIYQYAKISFLNSVRLLEKNNKFKNRFITYLLVFDIGHFPYFNRRYPFVKTDFGLSAYCHGNADFPNEWEWC